MRCLLVDKIVSLEAGQRIVAVKNVTMSESFLRDHFPGFPVMPGMLQLEAAAQTGSWLVYASASYASQARLHAVAAVKFREFVVPGDQMRIEFELKVLSPESARGNARIFVGDKLKTDIKGMELRPVSVAELDDPQAARAHFDFISGAAPMGGYSKVAGNRL